MGKETIEAFKNAIRRTHGCEATYVRSVQATDIHEGQTVWSRVVHVFRLEGHPKADLCYVWVELVDDVSGRQRYYTVLNVPPVDSPEAAVRASIIADAQREPE